MNISNQTLILICIFVGLLIFLVYTHYNDNGVIKNDGNLEYEEGFEEDDYEGIEMVEKKKMRSKNSAKDGKYKYSSYDKGIRGENYDEFNEYFDKNNDMIKDVYIENSTFQSFDETGDKFAKYMAGPRTKMTDEELFDVDQLLPKEENEDWFEAPAEAISVKNNHLINLSRPLGVNIIGHSNKNPSLDIRGTIPNPKNIISPFLQSSIEPDIFDKGLL